MCKPKNLGLLALIKRSGRLSLKACDAQNLGHNRPPVVGFPIREDAAVAQSHAETEDFWALRDSVSQMLQDNAPTLNFDLSVPIAKIGECVDKLMQVMTTRFAHLKAVFFGHVGDGNIHAVVGPIPQDGVTQHQVEEAFYAIIRDYAGSVSAEHGIGLHKKQWLGHSRSPQEIALMTVLKNAMDPRNILNPGKIL